MFLTVLCVNLIVAFFVAARIFVLKSRNKQLQKWLSETDRENYKMALELDKLRKENGKM